MDDGNRSAGRRNLPVRVGDCIAETPPAKRREEQGVSTLRGMLSTAVVKTTGVVELRVATLWPSVSLQISTALVNGVDAYNQRTRQGQATAERKFVEGRLAVARANLRAS